MCYLWVYRRSESNQTSADWVPVQLQTFPLDQSIGHTIHPCPAPHHHPPFQHRRDCSFILALPFPWHPRDKSTAPVPVETQRGRVWLLTLNPLWSDRLLSKNRWHLGKLGRKKTHTREKGPHSQTPIHVGKSSQGGENKSLLMFFIKLYLPIVRHSATARLPAQLFLLFSIFHNLSELILKWLVR